MHALVPGEEKIPSGKTPWMHIASAKTPTCPHFSRLKLMQELKLVREVAEVAKARMQVKEEDEAEAKVAKEEAKVARVAKVAKEPKPRW